MSNYLRLIIIAVLLLVIIVFILYMGIKRRRILQKLRFMTYSEKCSLLNSLVENFGYEYLCSSDIFSTTIDAWQQQFGYTYLYDRGAAGFNMVFDSEPIYFNYNSKTWLIELWKGQYGINTGGEIGIYHSDRILDKKELKKEIFKPVSNNELFDMSFILCFKNNCIKLTKRHWWLTAFCMGIFTEPADIAMEVRLHFPNTAMLRAFTEALLELGYQKSELLVRGNDIIFDFNKSHSQHLGIFTRMHRYLVQRQNHFFCKLFISVTKPLDNSADRLLFLYYHLPRIFRHTLRLHGSKKLNRLYKRKLKNKN